MRKPALLAALLVAGAAVVAGARHTIAADALRRLVMGKQADGSALVPTNQRVKPFGLTLETPGARPRDMALSPDGQMLAVLTSNARQGVLLFNVKRGEQTGSIALNANALGIAWSPEGKTLYASSQDGTVADCAQEDGKTWRVKRRLASIASGSNPQPLGLAVSPDGKRLYAALGVRNAIAAWDLPEGKLLGQLPVGVAPYRILLSPDGNTLYVANRGGQRVRAGEKQAALSAGTPVRVDALTDAAARGSLSIVDVRSLATAVPEKTSGTTAPDTTKQRDPDAAPPIPATSPNANASTTLLRATAQEIAVGRQPSALAVSHDGRRLYIANSDDDTLLCMDTVSRRVLQTVSLAPSQDPGFGQMPTALALSDDDKTLYVACSGGNAVAVIGAQSTLALKGFLPAGWFPIALAQREGRLMVASGKGIGARLPSARNNSYNVHSSVGTVQFVSDVAQVNLDEQTRLVAANNRWGLSPGDPRNLPAVPVPARVGEPSVFKHVMYIIKENQTYDAILGDMPEGNGDKSLNLFGETITPNQHALARQFVLLDNTYTSGTNSADGHQWCDEAIANAYIEQNYGANTRSYPYDGGDPLAYSPRGFLWTAASRKKLNTRVYGEFVNRPEIRATDGSGRATWSQVWQDYKEKGNKFQITASTDNAALRPFLHPNFIGFPLTVSDQWRADQFLADLAGFERDGNMPALSIMLLPCDHTSGTRAGMPTPRAAVADNDLALGRIVDAVSHSRFWKDTLILVIEDDSQAAVDHVDGHRTTAFCVSPYTRRKTVISEMYNHTSLLRTIELVLGLPPMTRFDRSADSMEACFTPTADFTPFTHLSANVALDEMNGTARQARGETKRLVEQCAALDWSAPDRADADVVARAIWANRKPGKPFPAALHSSDGDDKDAD